MKLSARRPTYASVSTYVKNTAIIVAGLALAVLRGTLANAAEFEAYYTRLDRSIKGDAGKYSDLVVVIGKANRLEFANTNGYLPQWRTAKSVHQVENLIPNASEDPNCFYNYVRLMENSPDRIVVQWRHFKDAERVAKANEALDPLDPHGITGRGIQVKQTQQTPITPIISVPKRPQTPPLESASPLRPSTSRRGGIRAGGVGCRLRPGNLLRCNPRDAT